VPGCRVPPALDDEERSHKVEPDIVQAFRVHSREDAMRTFRRRARQIIRAAVARLSRFVRQLQREGRPITEVKAFQSQQIVLTVNADQHRHKVLQILFGKDGSLYVTFPYFAHTDGILAEVNVTGRPGSTSQIDLANAGKVASHLVKYSHHPDGQAHFSQDGKVRTVIRRQSVLLYEQQGHIFTVLIQGLRAFEAVAVSKENKISAKRTTLTFQIGDRFPKAVRIVGRWYWIEDLNFDPRPAGVGPVVRAIEADGSERNAFILANPKDPKHVLLLTCIPQDAISTGHDAMMFMGGFDPPSKIFKSKKPTRGRMVGHSDNGKLPRRR
jgi:hypothetical protein